MNLENDNFLKISDVIINSYIEEWKKDNKKVIGHYCTYIPEELLHAAGLLPYRIRATGNEDTDLGDIYMVRFTCSFVRMTLDLALKGGFDFLDGLFISNCCDHARRMYELFDMKVFSREQFKEKPPRFYTPVPHVITEEGFDYYLNEVRNIKVEIEEKFNIGTISDEKLKKSIELYNENRELMREIHKLRILEDSKLTGTEALKISMANNSVPKEIANKELKRILGILKGREGTKSKRKRIMIAGSVVDNVDFIKVIESAGGDVISDFLCFGTRNFIDDVVTNSGKDPLEEIARRVYFRMSCPRMMDDHPRRLEFMKKQIKEANIEGILVQRINNCDLHGCENMLLEHEFKDLNVPIFNIDRENFQKDNTRLQTRIEAFIEMIK